MLFVKWWAHPPLSSPFLSLLIHEIALLIKQFQKSLCPRLCSLGHQAKKIQNTYIHKKYTWHCPREIHSIHSSWCLRKVATSSWHWTAVKIRGQCLKKYDFYESRPIEDLTVFAKALDSRTLRQQIFKKC